MLVMDENRMMGSSPESLKQLKSLILRDRNHPCVILWALGNEEMIAQLGRLQPKKLDRPVRFFCALSTYFRKNLAIPQHHRT